MRDAASRDDLDDDDDDGDENEKVGSASRSVVCVLYARGRKREMIGQVRAKG